MRRYVIALAAALTAAPLSAQTDTAEGWPVGSRVRVWTAANRNVVGQLKEIRSDTLIIEMTGILTHEARIPTTWAVRVDISEGQRLSLANVAEGALGGAALGALTTLVLDEALGDLCPRDECEGRSADYKLATILGAVVGAVAGATQLEDKWREVGFPGRITIEPGARRTGIGLSIAFR
jgi:hypothetical protein